MRRNQCLPFSIFSLFLLLTSPAAFLNFSDDGTLVSGVILPELQSAADTDCELKSDRVADTKHLKVPLIHRRRERGDDGLRRHESVVKSSFRDAHRIGGLYRRIQNRKVKGANRRMLKESVANQLVATLESGMSVGSGEYLMDVFIGSPPRHFSLILDTGSDLNWVQCLPCQDCFDQHGPPYDPSQSSSYKPVSCSDSSCLAVARPDSGQPCRAANQTCEYFYWYGDQSNTTGDLATETLTVNISTVNATTQTIKLDDVLFGCGHWNRGLFHGAAGLLGLGRGDLSFPSQLESRFGRKFSYCLVDRDANSNTTSRLVFGEDESLAKHPDLQFTEFIPRKDSPIDTFYYVRVRAIRVGGDTLDILPETFEPGLDGSGGTIIDSGTTLSYFPEPVIRKIKAAFISKIKGLSRVMGFPVLDPCYDVSGMEQVDLPEFSILFSDGAVWRFPTVNYFIRLEQENMICLALLGTPHSKLSIIGNYQQQNFHILYDLEKSRLGFAPMKCADL